MFKYLWIIVLGLIFWGVIAYTAYLAYKYIEENNGFDLSDFEDDIATYHELLAALWCFFIFLAVGSLIIACLISAIVFFKGE